MSENAAFDLELWKSLAAQVPALVVFALCMGFVITLFIRTLRDTTRDFAAATKEIAAGASKTAMEEMREIKRMGDECHTFQMKFADKIENSIEANTRAIDRNTEVLAGLSRGVCPMAANAVRNIELPAPTKKG